MQKTRGNNKCRHILVLNTYTCTAGWGGTYDCFFWRCDPALVMPSSFLRFLDHTQRRTTLGMTPLDEWSARRRDISLTTHNTHNRQTSMPQVGFETTISAGERPQTYALDRAATGTGAIVQYSTVNHYLKNIRECWETERHVRCTDVTPNESRPEDMSLVQRAKTTG